MPNLIILSGETAGQVYEWQDGAIRIGRNAANDFVIANASVSSEHCVIEPSENGGWRVKDLDSTNGTRVNDARVSMATLHRNDVIAFGDISVAIRGDDVPASDDEFAESADSIPRTTIVMRPTGTAARPTEGFSKKSESKRLLNAIIGLSIVIVIALVILIFLKVYS